MYLCVCLLQLIRRQVPERERRKQKIQNTGKFSSNKHKENARKWYLGIFKEFMYGIDMYCHVCQLISKLVSRYTYVRVFIFEKRSRKK